MTPPKTMPPKEQPALNMNEQRQARSFQDYEEKLKLEREQIKRRRVNYIVKDLPIY